jgi:hypothetical protein
MECTSNMKVQNRVRLTACQLLDCRLPTQAAI